MASGGSGGWLSGTTASSGHGGRAQSAGAAAGPGPAAQGALLDLGFARYLESALPPPGPGADPPAFPKGRISGRFRQGITLVPGCGRPVSGYTSPSHSIAADLAAPAVGRTDPFTEPQGARSQMHSQRGAAHVPIMFFLTVLLLFLGALGYAYVVTDANTNLRNTTADLRAQITQKDQQVTLMTHYIEDLGKVIELPGKYVGRANMMSLYGGTSLEVPGVISPENLVAKINELGSAIDIVATRGFPDLSAAVITKVNGLKQRATDAETARDTAIAEKTALDASFREATASHTQKTGELGRNIEQWRADYESSKGQKDTTIAGLQQNLVQKDDQLAVAAEAHTAEKKKMQGEINRLYMHNTALTSKDRLRVPPEVADGKIVSARSGLASAFISLGRKDMLQTGTIFRVRNPNHEAIKAYATVTRVEQDRAEVQLSGVVDPIGDAVREGDQLYNDLYSAGDANKRTVCMMGRFSFPYNQPQLKVLLENLGNKVVGKMTPGVDTVILGDHPYDEATGEPTKVEESDEYKLANSLGVEFVPLRKIRDLLKL
jgi:hypothetical protein